jgi:hypothetical protein
MGDFGAVRTNAGLGYERFRRRPFRIDEDSLRYGELVLVSSLKYRVCIETKVGLHLCSSLIIGLGPFSDAPIKEIGGRPNANGILTDSDANNDVADSD